MDEGGQLTGIYRLAGHIVQSDIPLELAAAGSDARPHIHIRVDALPPCSAAARPARLLDGIETVAEAGDGCIHAEKVGRWRIVCREDEGIIHPTASVPPRRLSFLTQNMLLPLILCLRGCLAIHGVAIGFGDRAAIVMGPSGAGKSTLGRFALAKGRTVLTDDIAATYLQDDCWLVEGAEPFIRLRPSADHLLSRWGLEGPEGMRRGKLAVPLPLGERRNVAMLAVLGPRDGDRSSLIRMDAGPAMIALDQHLLWVPLVEAAIGSGALFRRVTNLLGKTPCHTLQVGESESGMLAGLDLIEQAVRTWAPPHSPSEREARPGRTDTPI